MGLFTSSTARIDDPGMIEDFILQLEESDNTTELTSVNQVKSRSVRESPDPSKKKC